MWAGDRVAVKPIADPSALPRFPTRIIITGSSHGLTGGVLRTDVRRLAKTALVRLQALPRQRHPDRSEHEGGSARGPHGAARGRRQFQRRPGVHGADQRQGGRDAVDQEHSSRAADRQDRARRADRADGAGRSVDPVREGRADGPDAVRPSGLGQDDDLRQAGPAAAVAGPQADAGRRRPPAPGGRRAAQGHRRPDRRAGLQPGRFQPGRGLPAGPGRGQPQPAATR